MIRPGRCAKSIAVSLSATLALLVLAARAAAADWVGRPLAEALNALRSDGFSVIFSSQLVPDALRVTVEPRSGDAAEVATEILKPHGLELQNVAPGLFAVVRADAGVVSLPAAAVALGAHAEATPLDEVVVAASRYTLGPADGARHLAGGELAQQPKYADDPLRAVARLPGVTSNGNSARLNMRGSDADEVLLLVDGFPLRQAFHVPGLQGPFSSVAASVVSNLDVYTGGFPVRYGERMGGVIDMDTVDPDVDPRHSLGASTYDVSARTAGVVSESLDLDGLVSARAGILPNLVDRLATDVRTPTFSDGIAKLRWRPGAATTITAEALWSRDDLATRDPARGEFARLTSSNQYFWVRGQQQFDRRWNLDSWIGYSSLQSLRSGDVDNPGVVSGAVSDDRSAQLWDFRWRMHGDLSERRNVEFGGEWQVGDADYSYQNRVALTPQVARLYQKTPQSSLDTVIAPYRRDAALFGAYRTRLGGRATSEFGLRVQRSSGLGLDTTWLWDPRAMFSFEVGPSTRLRASWGRFHQTDEVQELRVEDGQRGFTSPQRSDHAILGLEHRDTRGVDWRAELFRKVQATPRPRFENMLNPLSLLGELEPDRVRISPDRAELRGVEISATYAGAAWAWNLDYSWSDANDEIGGVSYHRSWDQTHTFGSTLDWHGGPWTAGAALNVHTGWPTTALLYDAAGNPSLGTRNNVRWRYFAALDLRAGYRLVVRRGELLFTLDVTNTLDRRNLCCSELLAPPSGVSVEPLTLLPFTPTASVRWNF